MENVYTQNADSPNCLEAKEENPDGKVFIFIIYLKPWWDEKVFIESLIWSQTSLFGHDDDDGKNENVDDVLKKIQSPINKPIVWCTFRLLVFQLWFFFHGRVL